MANRVHVAFGEQRETFDTSKEAYIWLLRKFINNSDVISRKRCRYYITRGRCRTYLAQDRTDLFQQSPHMANDPSYFEEIARGWFTITNLSDDIKFGVLSRFAAMAGFKYEIDWKWEDGVNRPPPVLPLDI